MDEPLRTQPRATLNLIPEHTWNAAPSGALTFYLAEGQRLAHTGSWAFNAAGFEYWSSELFRIHGLDPGGKTPTIAEYMALVHPEDRDDVTREIQKINKGRFRAKPSRSP